MERIPSHFLLTAMLLTFGGGLLLARAPSQGSSGTPREPGRTSYQHPQDTFSESVDVLLAELDVVVRDRRGAYVTGLTASDFELREDGQPRPIRSFTASASAPEDRFEIAGGTPSEADSTVRESAGEEEQTTVVLFLDHAVLTPTRQSMIVKQLKRFLSDTRNADKRNNLFGRNTRFAAVTNRVPLGIAVPPTFNLAAFAGQLDTLPIPPATSIRPQLDYQRTVQKIGGGGGGNTARFSEPCSYGKETTIRSALTEYIADVIRRNDKSSQGLAALVAILGGIDGRKVVFYVGGHYELDPGLEMVARAERACPNKRFTSFSAGAGFARELTEIASQANANRVTIYTFDSEGSRIDVDPIGQRSDPQFSHLRSSNVQDALALIARETGGRAFFNTYDPTWGIERVSNDLRHTYSIAFEPTPTEEDGSSRKIKVALVGSQFRGFEVSFRRTIQTRSLEQRLAVKLFAALWMNEQTNILGISAAVVQPEQVAEPKNVEKAREVGSKTASQSAFEIKIRIPYSKLVLDETNFSSEIRLFMMARNPKSGARTQPRHELRQVSPEELLRAKANGAFEFLVAMDLPNATYDVAVGVRDELTSRTSVVVTQKPGVAEKAKR